MKIGLLQYDISSSPDLSLERLLPGLHELVASGCQLICLPEFSLTGFQQDLSHAEDDPLISRLQAELTGTSCILSAGFAIREDEKTTNRTLVMNSEGIIHRYDKVRLFTYWNEHKVFAAGQAVERLNIAGVNCAFLTCYDLRFPELFRQVAGAEVMIVSANWPSKRNLHWQTLLRARAIENQCFVVGINRIGKTPFNQFSGLSAVISPEGDTLLELDDKPHAASFDLDLASLHSYRKSFPSLNDYLSLPCK